ncbi:MAG TPA: FAD-dependent oxidoreductase, partial [Chloroflexota bacterium]
MVVGELTQETELLVIGGGPGGYAAAFRAADLGMDVAVVDESGGAGGVCLFRGCIPSKALLHVTEPMYDAARASEMGIAFEPPRLDLERLRGWRDGVVAKLAAGLSTLADRRGVQMVKARAVFEGPDVVRLYGSEIARFKFRHAIIASGSRPAMLPGVECRDGGRIMDSTTALALDEVPETLLVVGGGYVGLELGSVYAALGSKVSMVEAGANLLPGLDPEIVRPLRRRIESSFESLLLGTRVKSFSESPEGVSVTLDGEAEAQDHCFSRVL